MTAATLLAVASLATLTAAPQTGASGSDSRPTAGVCQREADRLVGRKAFKVGGKVRTPKKTRDIPPKYSELPPGTTGSGAWMGEALIDTTGKVARVWTIREVKITPPLPAFNKAIVDAIRQWEFEPAMVDNKPVPVCMTVTVNINWA